MPRRSRLDECFSSKKCYGVEVGIPREAGHSDHLLQSPGVASLLHQKPTESATITLSLSAMRRVHLLL